MSFTRWLDRAETIAARRTGLDTDSLGAEGCGWCSRDAYDDGAEPGEWVDHVIAASGFPVERTGPATPATAKATTVPDFRKVPAHDTIRRALDQRKVLGTLPILY